LRLIGWATAGEAKTTSAVRSLSAINRLRFSSQSRTARLWRQGNASVAVAGRQKF
jgi:hypothetical protein